MKRTVEGYDVIGDVHGMATKLESLLYNLRYCVQDGVWRHPTRQAVFVGDLIDRGPEQLETLAIVRRMVESGSALCIQGNHEFNAISYGTWLPDGSDSLRTRKGVRASGNYAQHKVFLNAVGSDTQTHYEVLDWFRTLPLWLDLGGLRVIHACWDESSIEALASKLTDTHCVTEDMLLEASVFESEAYNLVDILVKGPEIDLKPYGVSYSDQEGVARTTSRYPWWKPTNRLREAGGHKELPDMPISPPVPSYTGPPVVFGHYWRTGTPTVDSANATCVDYSACLDGNLIAYRWSGETILSDSNFCCSGINTTEATT